MDRLLSRFINGDNKMNKTFKQMVVVVPGMIIGGILFWRFARWFVLNKKKLSTRRKDVSINIVTSSAEWEIFYPKLMSDIQTLKVVGFDTEWVNDVGKRNPVALMQIATHQGQCALVRLCHMHHDVPSTLKCFLSDRSILKVGVGVSDDGKKLLKDYGLAVRGCVDLRNVLVRVRGIFQCPNNGLQGLCEGILGQTLNKERSVRCGNWEAETLCTDQIDYAAADAMVAVDIFIRLVLAKLSGKKTTNNREPPQWGSNSYSNSYDWMYDEDFNNISEAQFWQTATSLCQGLVDGAVQTSQLNPVDSMKISERKHDRGVDMLRAYSMRQKPLYDNCQLTAPDGQMLCTCNYNKAQWYISKRLGDKVSDNPLVVKLRFEPAGRPDSERNYYLQNKDNVCVVCGATDGYIRKFIVPQEYRKYFPPSLKDHRSHDILLLCPPCHQISSQHDGIFREQLAIECDAPLESGSGARSKQDRGLQTVKSAAKALKLNSEKIPESRKEELKKVILDHFGLSSITDDILEKACSMDVRIINEDYVSHGQKVVNKYKSDQGLVCFEKKWRQHFLDTMQPQYLPSMWSVDHNKSGIKNSDLDYHMNKIKSEEPSTSSKLQH